MSGTVLRRLGRGEDDAVYGLSTAFINTWTGVDRASARRFTTLTEGDFRPRSRSLRYRGEISEAWANASWESPASSLFWRRIAPSRRWNSASPITPRMLGQPACQSHEL